MIPALFEYARAESVDHAVSLLGEHGEDAKIIAGGHSLLPLMRLRFARPSVLVDIDRLSDLEYVRDAGDHVAIGALTRIADLEDDDGLRFSAPLLAYAAGQVGDPQVRHRGTIGGSVAHSDPASDLPTVLLALGATFVAQGPDGQREVAAADMFKGIFESDLGPQDVLTEVRVPKPAAGTGWSYEKFHRRAIDWAIVGVAALVERSNGEIGKATVTLTNMGSTAIRASGVEAALDGSDGSADSLRAAAEHATENTSPPSDTNASAEYRQELSKVLVRRALEEALAR